MGQEITTNPHSYLAETYKKINNGNPGPVISLDVRPDCVDQSESFQSIIVSLIYQASNNYVDGIFRSGIIKSIAALIISHYYYKNHDLLDHAGKMLHHLALEMKGKIKCLRLEFSQTIYDIDYEIKRYFQEKEEREASVTEAG